MSIAAEKTAAPSRRLLRLDAGEGDGPSSRGLLRRDLRWSVADASAYSIMVGLGETYFPAFALALGMGGVAAGLVATVPVFFGAILQLAAPWAVRRGGSHRRWVVACAACQGISLLVMPWASLVPSVSGWVVYVAATLYWAAGLSSGPAWSTWIESIVPRRLRARFFGRRARIAYASVLTAFVVGGLMLEAGKLRGAVLGTFALLFCVAAGCRFGSAGFLARRGEPLSGRLLDRRVGWGEMLSRVRGEASGRLLAYLFATQVAVQMASPYFVPYMLSSLKFSYLEFTLLVGLAYFGKCVTLPYWGRLAEVIGSRRLMVLCGVAIVPLPTMWLVSDSLGYLVGLQLVAGGIWAGFELAMLLMFFDAIPTEERTSLLTVYNLGNSVTMVAGTLLGAAVLGLSGESHAGYLLVFFLSSAGRLATLTLLSRVRAMDSLPEPATPGTQPAAVRPGPVLAPLGLGEGSIAAAAAGCTVAAEGSQ